MATLGGTVHRTRRLATLLFVFVCSLLATGVRALGESPRSAPAPATPLDIVCTTGMIADIVRAVGMERVRVNTLMGEGVDPHLYKPTRTDIAALSGADVCFYNGLLLEGKMTDALVRVANAGRKVLRRHRTPPRAAAPVEPDEFADGHHDPHVWMDPSAWATAVHVVRDALREIDPRSRDAYTPTPTRT
jgi:manganese/zinc/iron transport system substrate-binding protein